MNDAVSWNELLRLSDWEERQQRYLYYLLLSEAVALRRLGRTSDAVVLEQRAKKTLPLT